MQRDAWVLWGAYDLGSFPAMPKGLRPEQFMAFVRDFVASKASCLVVEEDHRYFRDKRGPVALISIDNYLGGWRIEPQFDFFFWASKRQRLAAVVSFLNIVRKSPDIGVCVVRVADKDKAFCEHLNKKYGLLNPCGRLPNASEYGSENIFFVNGQKRKPLALVKDERRAA